MKRIFETDKWLDCGFVVADSWADHLDFLALWDQNSPFSVHEGVITKDDFRCRLLEIQISIFAWVRDERAILNIYDLRLKDEDAPQDCDWVLNQTVSHYQSGVGVTEDYGSSVPASSREVAVVDRDEWAEITEDKEASVVQVFQLSDCLLSVIMLNLRVLKHTPVNVDKGNQTDDVGSPSLSEVVQESAPLEVDHSEYYEDGCSIWLVLFERALTEESTGRFLRWGRATYSIETHDEGHTRQRPSFVGSEHWLLNQIADRLREIEDSSFLCFVLLKRAIPNSKADFILSEHHSSSGIRIVLLEYWVDYLHLEIIPETEHSSLLRSYLLKSTVYNSDWAQLRDSQHSNRSGTRESDKSTVFDQESISLKRESHAHCRLGHLSSLVPNEWAVPDDDVIWVFSRE